MMKVAAVVLLFGIAPQAAAFAPCPSVLWKEQKVTSLAFHASQSEDEVSFSDRRDLFRKAAITAITAASFGASSLFPGVSLAADGNIGTDPDHPIAVVGAGGKCGLKCVELLAERGLYTRAITRSGREVLSAPSQFVSYAPGDVKDLASLKAAVKDASGVIFAASASGKKKGGTPEAVDYLGVYNTAKACIDCAVPKLVVISSATVTRPDSIGFKATNFAIKYIYGEKIMDHKIAGEAVMRDLYASSGGKSAYCVIRPGGLSDGKGGDPSILHVSQGDVYASEIAREDVSRITVAALLKGKETDNTTIEVNQLKGLNKAQADLPDLPKELVHAGGSSFEGLLDGLLSDSELKNKFPSLISDFRGDGIVPIEKLAT